VISTQTRALCAVRANTQSHLFLLGTMSLRAPNVVLQLRYEEEKSQLEQVRSFPVSAEVLSVVSDPLLESRFVAIHPQGNLSLVQEEETVKVTELGLGAKIVGVAWQKQLVVATSRALHVVDCGETLRIGQTVEVPENVTACTSDPHHSQLYAVTQGLDIAILDLRSKETKSKVLRAHSDAILELDYNPNKPYSLVSGSKDCTIRLWDVRKAEKCLKCVQEHSHWVWQAKFNSFHDQLVITSSSDNRIILHRLVSVSSTPVDESFYGRESDAVLMRVEDFNESVYAVAWSAAEAWFFAAVSFDGKVGVFQVPAEEKYRILL